MLISIINDEISKSLEETKQFCIFHNVKFIELRSIDGRNITDFSLDEILSIKKYLDKNEIGVSGISSPLLKRYPISNKIIKEHDNFAFKKSKNQKDIIEKTFQMADILESKYIRGFTYLKYNNFQIEDLIEILKYINDKSDKFDKYFLIENEPVCNLDKPIEIIDIIKKFKLNRCELLFDIGNLYFSGFKFNYDDLDYINKHCNYYHIKDYSSKTGKYICLGKGDINYKLFFQKVISNKNFFSLETHTNNIEDVSKSLNYLKKTIGIE